MATIEHYLLVVAVNGTSSSNTTVPASTNSVNIFEALPNISQKKYTTYSLRVASVSNTGQSYLTNPVSVGKITAAGSEVFMTYFSLVNIYCPALFVRLFIY